MYVPDGTHWLSKSAIRHKTLTIFMVQKSSKQRLAALEQESNRKLMKDEHQLQALLQDTAGHLEW